MDGIYGDIARDIEQRVKDGGLRPGDKLFSLKEICGYYGVSNMTAARAVNALKAKGVVQGVKGKGVFILDLGSDGVDTPRREAVVENVVVHSVKDRVGRGSFLTDILAGVYQECAARSLGNRTEYLVNFNGGMPNVSPFELRQGEGVVAVTGLPFLRATAAAVEQGAPLVLVDCVVSGVPSVLTDNHQGVAALLDHLMELGHRRVSLASRFGHSQNFINENERVYAFENELRHRDLQGKVVMGPDFDALLDDSTAVMFTQDAPALRFIQHLRSRGIRVPEDVSVTGFDGNSQSEPGLETLTTVQVDCAAMGRAAVAALCSRDKVDPCSERVIRIPVTLAARGSSATAPKQPTTIRN